MNNFQNSLMTLTNIVIRQEKKNRMHVLNRLSKQDKRSQRISFHVYDMVS